MASLVYALTLTNPKSEYLLVAEALNQEAELRIRGFAESAAMQHRWAEIGRRMMDSESSLFVDLISEIEISGIPLDPRFIDRFI